jgi:hypothetical protein
MLEHRFEEKAQDMDLGSKLCRASLKRGIIVASPLALAPRQE